MITQIRGLHHVTSMAADAGRNNAFLTNLLGLRRVKKTVNFDAPDVYHLYYGDETGSPGTVMTYFPFPNIGKGRAGAGEVSTTAFSIPAGAAGYWRERLAAAGVSGIAEATRFGEIRIEFEGPDGDHFALVEAGDDPRHPWTGGGIPEDVAIRGFHSVSLRLRDAGATSELARFMGYERALSSNGIERLVIPSGNGASVLDIEASPSADLARLGAGSVHHVAFAVDDRAAQLAVRAALNDTGYAVTPVIDRDYFWAIYFRTPGGVLFEVATNEPGFERDEERAHLGEGLRLPTQHAHLRPFLEQHLPPLE